MTNDNHDQDDAVNGAELLDEVAAVVARYVILPSPAASVAVVLWIAATHAVPAWNCAPRLVIRAPEKRCGKSRLLDMVEAMSHRPLMTTNASPSAVYRSIGMAPSDPPTLLIDEADTIFGPKAGDNEDLRGLLNAGHQRGRPALRYDAGTRSVEKIETFAMAALAGIGLMPDTIEDRAAVIRMRRRAAGERVAPYRVQRDRPRLDDLRQRLNQWVTAHLDVLTKAAPAMPLEDRAADTWEPLIALADLAGGEWPACSRQAALALLADLEENSEMPLKVRLLADCRTAFGEAAALPSAVLVQRLRADDEAPWADLQNTGGTGLTVRRLAAMLREYDISSSNKRWQDGTQSKGYARDDFADAWSRYCPTDPKEDDDAGDPSQPSQASLPRSERDGSNRWDGSTVPTKGSVPGLTCEATVGTDGTDTRPNTGEPICIRCRQPLTDDDGTRTHPNCA
jgi:hypothetical protein